MNRGFLTLCRGLFVLGCLSFSPLEAKDAEHVLPGLYPHEQLVHCLSEKGAKDPFVLYRDAGNPFIQSFNVTFRAQYQGAMVDANQGKYPGSHRSTTEWRRLRLGWNAGLFHAVKLVNVWNLGGVDGAGYYGNGRWNDRRQAVGNMFDLHVEHEFTAGKLTLGKTLPLMMMEYRLPSSSYSLVELSVLEEQLRADNSYGVSFSGMDTAKDWGYYLGIWSDTERAYRKAWGTWNSAFMTTGISKIASLLGMKKGRVYLDWVYNFADMGDRWNAPEGEAFAGTKARHVFALYYKGENGPFELNLEALAGIDQAAYKVGGQVKNPSNVVGLVAMPGYMITPHVQAVFRAQWAKGDDGVVLMRRYNCIVPTQGSYVDEYKAVALGFNFYLYPENRHRMKMMTMVEYGHSLRKVAPGGATGWSLIGGVYLDF